MSILAEITPRTRPRVIDLVGLAGITVSSWGHFKGGVDRAASNPKYCYEWSFVEPKKVVVMNLWLDQIEEHAGTLVRHLNARTWFGPEHKPIWKKRALKMDEAFQVAYRDHLPVRVIVCVGQMRDQTNPQSNASRVHKRLLDPLPWAITFYDSKSGACTITRGASPVRIVDQFSYKAPHVEPRDVSRKVFPRSDEVRNRARLRSGGRCEWCGAIGFTTSEGEIYIETHHIVPLSKDGPDIESNVAALCANHHREAHQGKASLAIQEKLRAIRSAERAV